MVDDGHRNPDTGGLTATVDWEPDPDNMFRVAATVALNAGPGPFPVMIDWGDGAPPEQAQSGAPAAHEYAETGTYTLAAWPVANPSGPGSVPVGIKDHTPTVHIYSDPDDDWVCLLWVDEPGDGTAYSIAWGDGTTDMIQRDPPPYPRVPHQYTAQQSYTVTVTDTSTRRTAEAVFDCGRMGMLFSFPGDDNVPFVLVSRMRAGATWELDWGDGTGVQTGTVNGTASLRRSHTDPMPPGDYVVTAREIVDGTARRTAQRQLTIPSIFNLQLQVGMSWGRTQTTRTVTATPYGIDPSVNYTVDWGDGTTPETHPGGTAATHTYTGAPPAAGWMLRITELADPARRFHRLIAEPTFVGELNLSAWTRWSVDFHVGGVDGLTNADWYTVDWDDGNIQDMAAVGAWWNTWHGYEAPGTYTVALDGPGMAQRVARQVVVPSYPQPTVTCTEDTTDPTRMTTSAAVANTECGGPATVRWGDGSTSPAPETGTVTHQYAAAGAYTVIVVCDADPTARGRSSATVPYGETQGLQAEIGRKPGGTVYQAQVHVTAYDQARQVSVDWDDGAGFNQITGLPYADTTYEFAGTYMPTVQYTEPPHEPVPMSVTVPFEEEP